MVTEHLEGRPEGIASFRVTLTPAQARSRRLRNIAIGLAVALIVVLFYAMTIAKLGGHGVLSSPMGDPP